MIATNLNYDHSDKFKTKRIGLSSSHVLSIPFSFLEIPLFENIKNGLEPTMEING